MHKRTHVDDQIERELEGCSGKCNWIGAAIAAVGALASSSMSSDAAGDAADSSSAASKYAADLQKQIYDQSRSDQEPWRQVGTGAVHSLAKLMGIPYQEFNQAGYDKALAAYDAAKASYSPDVQYVWNPTTGKLESTSQSVAALAPDKSAFYKTVGSSMPDLSGFYTSPGYQFRLGEGEKAINRTTASRGRFDSGATLKSLMNFNQNTASDEFGNYYNRMANMAGIGQTANQANASAGGNYANNVGNLMMTNAANQGNAALASGSAWASGLQGAGNSLGKLMGQGSYGFHPMTAMEYGTNPFSQQSAYLAAQW